ncbi:MAG: type II secretion system major pseudopilin GspG [Deltaproteobacteria bacterium]|nr:type II secretion system major pseudopilin GspG [Deltaproteobacteria bacterium]
MKRIRPATLRDSRGFTLIELMAVVLILGILAAWVAPRFIGQTESAKLTAARVQIESLSNALKFYRLDNGRYPTTQQGLEALVARPESGAPRWRPGGYLEKGVIPKDPWGNPYVYVSPGVHDDFDLSSYGQDGQPGGEGDARDINSWEIDQ